MRKSTIFITCLLASLPFALLPLPQAGRNAAASGQAIATCRREVARLQLTDLALFTEARYTRNLSLADRFAPFQDHPFALEHFPSGSLASPPAPLSEAP